MGNGARSCKHITYIHRLGLRGGRVHAFLRQLGGRHMLEDALKHRAEVFVHCQQPLVVRDLVGSGFGVWGQEFRV